MAFLIRDEKREYEMNGLAHTKTRARLNLRNVLPATALLTVLVLQYTNVLSISSIVAHKPKYQPQCPAQEVIGPVSHPEITTKNVETLFKSDAFKILSINRLSGAVQIPTEDFDQMGPVDEDERWDVFYKLEKYFKATFPLLHEHLELEVVNYHGLVYTWKGSNSTLKPILITGHQDVKVDCQNAESGLTKIGCPSCS